MRVVVWCGWREEEGWQGGRVLSLYRIWTALLLQESPLLPLPPPHHLREIEICRAPHTLPSIIQPCIYLLVCVVCSSPFRQTFCILAVAKGSHLVWQWPSPVTNRVPAVMDTSSLRHGHSPSMSVAVAMFITLTGF